MAVLKLQLKTARDTSTLTQTFETVGGNREIGNRIINYITSLFTGTEGAMSTSIPPSIAISIQENEVQASGNFIFDGVVATNTFVINGVTFTAVASGATGNQFNVGADDTATAVAAAAVVNASVTALVSGYVTASGAAGLTTTGVLTITSAFYGLSGNQMTLTGGTHVTASGTRATAGAADATAQTLQF